MNISQRITAKRKANGLTLEQLAKLAKCSMQRIRQFESGMIPAKSNSGALSRVKRVLKVRNGRGAAKKPIRVPRGTKPPKAINRMFVVNSDLMRLVANLAEAIPRLGLNLAELSREIRALAESQKPAIPKAVITNSLDKESQKSDRHPWGAPTKVSIV